MKHTLLVPQSSLYILEASSMSAFTSGYWYSLYTLSPFPGLNGHRESHFCVFSLFFCSNCKYLYFFLYCTLWSIILKDIEPKDLPM